MTVRCIGSISRWDTLQCFRSTQHFCLLYQAGISSREKGGIVMVEAGLCLGRSYHS